jgi:hypothetical protein
MDQIFARFLHRQAEDALALAAQSDRLDLLPVDSLAGPPSEGRLEEWLRRGDRAFTRYIARFTCRGLVRRADGAIERADRFDAAYWFPPDYLRRANPFQVLTWLAPDEIWHPNIGRIEELDRVLLCIGPVVPGTPLVDLLYRTFETITYNKVTMREDDALNRQACVWARQNQGLFPLDRGALKRRPAGFEGGALEVKA